MLGDIFYFVLNMSIAATVAGLVVLLLRQIKPLPRYVPYLLWSLPLIRFWMPFGLGSTMSLFNILSKHATRTVVVCQIREWEWSPALTFSNTLRAADSYFPIVYQTNRLEEIFQVAALIWAVIAAAALLTTLALYGFTLSEMKKATPLKGRVYLSGSLLSPAVFGILRPKILLHDRMDSRTRHYALLHEKAHIRRADNLWRVLAIVTACLHWFNSLSWVFGQSYLLL